jgi:hypothetical protein
VQTQITNHSSQITSPPRFVITLAADAPPAGAIRVPLAITGEWVRGATRFAITRADLESIVRNFRERQNGEINVDYDHASEMPEVAAGGPVPSAGRIVRLDPPEESKNGSRQWEVGNREKGPDFPLPTSDSRFLLYGWYEPTPRARELVKNREYRFISPAIEWAARHKRTGKSQGTTLTSVALTNRPFLEELPQIRLSDPSFQPVQESETRKSKSETRSPQHDFRVSNFDVRASNQGGSMKHVHLAVSEGSIRLLHEDFQDAYYLSKDDLHGCLTEAGMFSGSAPGTAITFAQARALLSEAEARGKFISAAEVFRAQAEQALEDAVKAGKILPRQRDDWRKIALSDLPTFRKLMGAQKPLVPVEPVGLAGTAPGDAQVQVKFLAEQRMRERQITFGQALSELGREQPDLVQQYRKAVSNE